MEQGRGQLTDRIKAKSKELLGFELTVTALRLLPYLLYTLQNSQRISMANINDIEQKILADWVQKGFIVDGVTDCGRPMLSDGVKFKVSKKFWDAMTEIIYLGYVDLK